MPLQILYPELLVVFIAIRFAVTEHLNQNLCRPINQRNHRCFGSLTIICSMIVYCIQKQLCLHSTIWCWWLHPLNVFFTSSSIKGMKEMYRVTCVPDMQILLYIEKQLNVRESKDHVLVIIYPFVDESPCGLLKKCKSAIVFSWVSIVSQSTKGGIRPRRNIVLSWVINHAYQYLC